MALLTRRAWIGAALAGGAGALTAASTGSLSRIATPASAAQAPGFYRYRVGSYELTALYDGVWDSPVDSHYIRNAEYVDVQRALHDAFMPKDKLSFVYTALLVNTGRQLVLLDAGTGGQIGPRTGSLVANLAAAGVDPRDIDVVAISHFHADHIDGLKTKDGLLVFANAEVLVPEPEWQFWMDDARLNDAPGNLRTTFLNARRIFSRHRQARAARINPGTNCRRA